jgi:hypothetical protein
MSFHWIRGWNRHRSPGWQNRFTDGWNTYTIKRCPNGKRCGHFEADVRIKQQNPLHETLADKGENQRTLSDFPFWLVASEARF